MPRMRRAIGGGLSGVASLLAACAICAGCSPNRTPANAARAAGAAAGAVAASNDTAADSAAASGAAASASNDAFPPEWRLPPDEITVDLFTLASPDRWTLVRHPPINMVVAARLTQARDAALVTWEPTAWCGISNPGPCKGGRLLLIVFKPNAAPGVANLGDRFAPVTLTINGVSKRQEDQDLGPPVMLPNDVTPAPAADMYGFLLTVDYASERALTRQVDHCRQITIGVLGRRFAFACDGLPQG